MSSVIKTKCKLLLLRRNVSRPTRRLRDFRTNGNNRSTDLDGVGSLIFLFVAADVRRLKSKAPNSKLQRSSKLQPPNLWLSRVLVLGAWSFSGVWMLMLGISFRASSRRLLQGITPLSL